MTPAAAIREAEAVYEERRLRDHVFSGYRDGFGEPAWDALLRLYIIGDAQRSTPIDDLSRDLDVTAATLRIYLRWLATQELVTIAGPDDGPGVRLTERGDAIMAAFLAARRQAA